MVGCGGRTTERGGTSRETSDAAPTTEFAPIVTPRSTVLRAHSHTPSSTTIGPLSYSNVGDRRSWLPVQTYTFWEMQTSDPMTMSSMLYSSAPVPTHELSPMESFHGQCTSTRCLINTPEPISAPNQRNMAHRSRLGHHTWVKISVDTATQSTCVANPRPLSFVRPRHAANDRLEPPPPDNSNLHWRTTGLRTTVAGVCQKCMDPTKIERNRVIVLAASSAILGVLFVTDSVLMPVRARSEIQNDHRIFLGKVALVGIAAASAVQLANVTATGLTVVCLLLAPGFLLMKHRGVDLVPLVLAALGWLSFLASCLVHDVSVLWPNALAPAAFAVYLLGLAVLTGRSVESIAMVLAGIAVGTVAFFVFEGIAYTQSGSFLFFWKYGIAHAVTILVLFGLTATRLPQFAHPVALALLGLASLGLNFRSHALVCLLAAATLFVGRVLGSRVRRGWQFAGIIVFGLLFAYVMPIVAKAGWFGQALQRKTIEQEAIGLPILLAGRTELPMTITAILERPLLGWGSAMNLTPGVYAEAEHLAVRMGYAPTFPFNRYWRLPPKDYSAMHSILLGAWSEGGILAALLPAWLLVACIGIVWSYRRFGRWAPLVLTVALQGIWDLLYAPWTYNMIAEYACIALLFCAVHFRGPPSPS
jgi:hypothetical protein